MARNSGLDTAIGIGGFIVVGYIVIRYVLPSLEASTVRNQSAGLFGFSTGPGGTRFSTTGNLSQLLALLQGKQQQQQPAQTKGPSAGGGGGGGGLPPQGLLPPSPRGSGTGADPLQNLNLWEQQGNVDLNQYFNQPGQDPSTAGYDTSGLDNITIPESPVAPLQPIDIPATPFVPTSSGGNDTISSGGDSFNTESYVPADAGSAFDEGGF